jgi:hypothetical protein
MVYCEGWNRAALSIVTRQVLAVTEALVAATVTRLRRLALSYSSCSSWVDLADAGMQCNLVLLDQAAAPAQIFRIATTVALKQDSSESQ